MNLAETCEQYLEVLHARIHAIQLHPGWTAEPPHVSACVRWRQNESLLQGWIARSYFKRLWRMLVLRHVLQLCALSKEFI